MLHEDFVSSTPTTTPLCITPAAPERSSTQQNNSYSISSSDELFNSLDCNFALSANDFDAGTFFGSDFPLFDDSVVTEGALLFDSVPVHPATATPDSSDSNTPSTTLSTPQIPLTHTPPTSFSTPLFTFDNTINLDLDILNILDPSAISTIPRDLSPVSLGQGPSVSPSPPRTFAPTATSSQPFASPPSSPNSTTSNPRKRKHAPVEPPVTPKDLPPIRVTPDDTEQDAKRKRNTAAARRYRQKKQDRMNELEDEVADLKDEREKLKEEVVRAKMEAQKWYEMVQLLERKR